MRTVEPIAAVDSAAWADASPAVSVVVATHNRAGYLPQLLAALAGQVGAAAYEIVLADDGSTDDTWPVLSGLVRRASLPIRALRLPPCGGPSVPRNTAAAATRGDLLAFTDDDCLPEPGWLAALAYGAGGIAAARHVVQGRTVPTEEGQVSPWDRTIRVTRPSGLWESCNLAVPRAAFVAAEGFPALDLLGAGGRGFGEDAVLGARVARSVGGAWAPDAVVRHRWERGDYRGYLDQMRRLRALPQVLAVVPELRERCVLGVFRNRRAAAGAAAGVGAVLAATTRRPTPLLAGVPWLVLLNAAARERWGRARVVRIGQEAVADVVAIGACARGSVEARTLLL